MQKITYIIDFDSTFIKVESLEKLIARATANHSKGEAILAEISELTNAGMGGHLAFSVSLRERFAILRRHHVAITQEVLQDCVEYLKDQLSESVIAEKDFFIENRDNIYIISGGFTEMIAPVVKQVGIDVTHILANRFLYDDEGVIVDYDADNNLAKDGGKVAAVKELKLHGNIVVVGDGYTDYEIKEAGYATLFFAFTENMPRQRVIDNADANGNFTQMREAVTRLENTNPDDERIVGIRRELVNLKPNLEGERR